MRKPKQQSLNLPWKSFLRQYSRQEPGLSVVYYALQTNHIHLIAEAPNNQTLTKGMRSLSITFAKRIQKLKHTHETIQLERYHLHVLKCPSEVENAVTYVLNNESHHSGSSNEIRFCREIEWA